MKRCEKYLTKIVKKALEKIYSHVEGVLLEINYTSLFGIWEIEYTATISVSDGTDITSGKFQFDDEDYKNKNFLIGVIYTKASEEI